MRGSKIVSLAILGFIVNTALYFAAASGPMSIAMLAIIGMFLAFLAFYGRSAYVVFEVIFPFLVGMFAGFLWASGYFPG